MVEQDLVVAGTWVKCAGVSRQGASLMSIAVPIWNDKVSLLLDTASKLLIIELCNIAFVQALCCNHATVRGTSKFTREIFFQIIF